MDDQLHLLTGAHALNALDQDERLRFEHTLGFGDETAEEARELAETAALLAAGTTPAAPPPDLKARLMAQIAAAETTLPRRSADRTAAASPPAPAGWPQQLPCSWPPQAERACGHGITLPHGTSGPPGPVDLQRWRWLGSVPSQGVGEGVGVPVLTV